MSDRAVATSLRGWIEGEEPSGLPSPYSWPHAIHLCKHKSPRRYLRLFASLQLPRINIHVLWARTSKSQIPKTKGTF